MPDNQESQSDRGVLTSSDIHEGVHCLETRVLDHKVRML
jgi:hypothetical protein